MRKLAKKFFSPTSGTQSIMQMRKWIDSGATAADLVRWIKGEYYNKTKEHRSKNTPRHHKITLFCMMNKVYATNSHITTTFEYATSQNIITNILPFKLKP